MRYIILIFGLISFLSCSEAPSEKNVPTEEGGGNKPAANPQADVPNSGTGALLQHSSRPMVNGSAADGNLCKVPFDDTMPLFPIADNPDGRAFDIVGSGGVYVVVISAGNTRSTFMLEPRGTTCALLSSMQAPECLSRKGNFFMAEDGAGFLYDGSKYIKYRFTIAKTPAGFRGVLTWDPGKEYGIRVRYKKQLD